MDQLAIRQTKALALNTMSISVPCSGAAGWFRPLRRPTFEGKSGQNPCPCIRPCAALRVPSLHPCSRGGAPKGRPWPYGARRPSMAVAPLRKGSTRPPEGTIDGAWNIARRSKSKSRAKFRLDIALLLLLFIHRQPRRRDSSLQEAERRYCVAGCRPWMACKHRRAMDGPSVRPGGSNAGGKGPGAKRRAGCRDARFAPLCQDKVARRKGGKVSSRHHREWIISLMPGP